MFSLRSSRRLQGQETEEDGLGCCFLCQEDFQIEQLPRLQRTICCKVLMHRSCLNEMVSHTSICGNCRSDSTPDHTRALPVNEEQPGNFWFGPGIDNFIVRLQHQVTREINEYRQFGLANPHRQGSQFWVNLPFDISDDILFEYLSKIEEFILEQPGETMFLHGFVVLPVEVSTEVRHCFYDLFLMNIPEAVRGLVNGTRFRFLFHHDEQQTRATITTKYVLSYGEPAWYAADADYV